MSTDAARTPNRSHGAVYRLPEEIRSFIDEHLITPPQWTYEQIAEHVKEEWGFEISVQQLSRYFKREGLWLQRYAKVKELTGRLRSQLGDDDTDPGTFQLAEVLLAEVLANAEAQQINSVDDLVKVVASLSKLSTSRAQVERIKMQIGRAVSTAFESLTERMRAAVGDGKPELLRGLVELAEQAQTELIQAAQGAK